MLFGITRVDRFRRVVTTIRLCAGEVRDLRRFDCIDSSDVFAVKGFYGGVVLGSEVGARFRFLEVCRGGLRFNEVLLVGR